MTHIKLDFFSKYCEQRGENYYQDLLYGDNTVQYRLLHLQNAIRNDKSGKYRKYGTAGIITNPLLRGLQADVYENRVGFDNPRLIIMQDALLEDKDNANALERAWDEMFNDYEHYTEDAEGNKTYYMREFAIDLAVYAFMTSGDQGGTSKFFKFVPNTIRKHLSANINGEEMSYNTYIRRIRENWQTELSDEEADAIAKDVIYENWFDNDFVRSVRLYTSKIITDPDTGRKRKTKNFQLTTKMYYTDRSSQSVRKYNTKSKKYYFVTETVEKKILSVIAGAKKVGNKLIETIYRNGDEYPPYIKVRRPSSDYRDNDNTILYEYQGQGFLDPENPEQGTYPVYRIVLPNTAKFRAGTYQYSLYGINRDERSCVYPTSVLNALQIMEHESPVSSSKDKEQLLKDVQESFNKMAIWMADDELEDFLIREYQANGITDTSNIQKDVEALKQGIDTNKSIKERQKQEKEKKKNEIHYEQDGSVDIWWGSKEEDRKNGELSNLAPRKVKFNGITYPSVEAAWQAQKLSYADMPVKDKKITLLSLQASDGPTARGIGKDSNVIRNLDTAQWDSVKYGLMHDIIKASFEQNKEARELLLSTKDAKLTHLKASIRDVWRTKFPEILTQVRSELKAEQKEEKKDKKPTSSPEAKELTVVDISKDEDFKSLSNTATRNVIVNGNEFPTVMHAYNYAIVGAAYVDSDTKAKYQQSILSATSMREIQQAVDEVVAIAGKKPLSQDVLDSLLYELMYMSFDQHPEAVSVLLNTESAEFKGVSDKVAENLKEIRAKFRQKEEENAVNDEEYNEGPEKHCTDKQ